MDVRGVLATGLAVWAIASGQATAGVNTWSAIGPVGGVVNKIAFSSTANTVFAIAGNGFYRSQDGGVTWQLVSSNFFNAPTDLRLDPSDPARIYVVAQNAPSLYVSTDGGTTLAGLSTLPTNVTNAWQLAVSQNGNTLYLTGGAQVFCSTDRGLTWQQRSAVGSDPIARITTLIIDPTDSNTLYASAITSATGEAILATHDGAITWTTLTAGSASSNVAFGLAINPANPMQLWAARNDGLWQSIDRGVTWTSVLSTSTSAVVIDPVTPAVVYAGLYPGRVMRTADAGLSWTDVTGNIAAGQVLSLAVNPAQDAQVMVAGIAGVAVSATSGTTWSMQQTGINSTTIDGLSADPTIDRIYIDVPTSGAYYEAAGSGTTQAVNNAGLLALQLPGATFESTAQLATAGHLYVSLQTGLAASSDGGSTWSLEPIFPQVDNQLFALASPAGAPQTVLVAPSTGLYRTTDAGGSWTAVGGAFPSGAVVGRLFTAPGNPLVAYASLYTNGTGVNLGVYSSADGGVTWSAASATVSTGPTELLAVDPATASTLYGATPSALLKSTDGGMTWMPLAWDSALARGYPNALTVDPVHPQILIASSVASIMRSVDGGATWETLRAANVLPTWTSFQLLVDPLRPENLLVGTLGSGVQQLTVAPDLALSVTAPSLVVAGLVSTYTYTVNNLGPFAATNVRVSLQLPPSAQNVSATIAGGTCNAAAGAIICLLPVMRSGASAVLTVNATAPATGPFAVTGTVSGDQPDLASANNSANIAITVNAAPPPASGSSGGAALSIDELLGLAGLLLLRRSRRTGSLNVPQDEHQRRTA